MTCPSGVRYSVAAEPLLTRPPRYDHFATLPYIKLFFNSRQSFDRLRFDAHASRRRASTYPDGVRYSVAAEPLLTRPPRYDHFATLPYIKLFFNSRQSFDRLRFDAHASRRRASTYPDGVRYSVAAEPLLTRPPRYDHFATLPLYILSFCLYPAVSRPFTV